MIGITTSPCKTMFVFRKVVFRKPLFKLLYVCLSLGKLVNGKNFLVNGNTFRSTENTLQSKKNLVWFPGKCFPFGCVCFPESGFREITFQTFLCLFAIRKVGQRKTLSSQRKFGLVFRKVFSWKIWAENTFWKLWKI